MPKKDNKESPKMETEQAETDSQKAMGLGELFKRKREKMGLSQEQVVEVTRLRKHFVEALENEDWDKLPSGVFVRGFITAYAQVLGLDEKKALSLYESSMPEKSVPPKPLVTPPKATIGPIFFLASLLIGIAVLILWILYPFSLNSPLQPDIEPQSEPRQKPPTSMSEAVPEPEKPATEIGTEKVMEGTKGEVNGAPQEEKRSEIASTVETPSETAVNDAATSEPSVGTEPDQTRFVLTGHVQARTWIRICVDDQEPKEYIFQPGSRPQWKGVEGFNILIGNAAGVEFDFNGERFENLGDLGKVVRLKLPQYFEGSKCED